MKRSIALALSAAMISTTLLTAGCGRKNHNTSTNNDGHIDGTSTTNNSTGGTNHTDGMGDMFGTDDSMGDTDTDGSDGTTSMPPGDTSSQQPEEPAYIKPQGFEDLDFGGKTFVIATQSGTDARWETKKEIYVSAR